MSTMFPAKTNPSSLSFSHLNSRLCQSAALSLSLRALPVRAEHFLLAEVTVMSADRPEKRKKFITSYYSCKTYSKRSHVIEEVTTLLLNPLVHTFSIKEITADYTLF